MPQRALELLADLLSQPEGSWGLADGALAIARLETPELDPREAREALDLLGRGARKHLGTASHPRFAAAAISRVLFFDERFQIATGENETPVTAMLDQVLAQRVGVPTALALIFIEVARRTGQRAHAVALPGRLLLRLDSPDQFHLFDPQAQGRPITIDQCRQLVAEATGGRGEFREAFLRPLSASQLLARLVAHLKAIYWRRGDHDRALVTVRLLLTIRPDDPREIRDKGRLYYLMGRLAEAIHAFEEYLHHNPRGEDAEAVRMLLLEARASLPS